jgi:hypothetical protein
MWDKGLLICIPHIIKTLLDISAYPDEPLDFKELIVHFISVSVLGIMFILGKPLDTKWETCL